MTHTSPDVAWLREVAADLASLPTAHDVVDTSIALLAHRFGSEVVTYSQLALGPLAHTPLPGVDRLYGALRPRLEEHPLFAPLVSGSGAGPAAPLLLSDVISVRQWRAHPVYNELLRPGEIPLHTICVPLTRHVGGRLEWYQINRDRDFSPREVGLLDRLQPVLIALTRRTSRPPSGPQVRLTARESELLQLLSDGMTVAAAARRLGVAAGTARKHLEHIHRKLDTDGPVATLRRAIDLGLVDLADP